MNRPANIQHYIKLITTEALSEDVMKAWYGCVRNYAPNGCISSVQTTDNKGSLRSASMVHREVGGGHEYIVPLCRDLTEQEAARAVDAFDALHDQDFEIEVSSTASALTNHPVEVEDDKMTALCTAWAKRQHENWMKERSEAGWSYGPSISLKNRTHPLMRQWHDLPDKFRKVDMEQPQGLLDLLNDQGYAVISRDELESILKLIKSAF